MDENDCQVTEKSDITDDQKADVEDTDYNQEPLQKTEDLASPFKELQDCNERKFNKVEKEHDAEDNNEPPEYGSIQLNTEEYQHEHDLNLLSPRSSAGSDCSIKVRTDLNKACQTQNQASNLPPAEHSQDVPVVDISEEEQLEEDKPEYYVHNEVSQPNYVTLQSSYENQSPEKSGFGNASESIQQSEVNFIEMDGMNLVLANDFIGSQVISQVEDYDFVQNRLERPRILMTIGNMDGPGEIFLENQEIDRLDEEHLSSGKKIIIFIFNLMDF